MTSEKKFPLQQGDLDSLCGVYATINALSLATKDHGWPDKSADPIVKAERLFVHLVERIVLATDGNLFRATTEGLDPPDVVWLVDIAENYWNDGRRGFRTSANRLAFPPVKNEKMPNFYVIMNHLKKGGQVILAYGQGKDIEHYTVVLDVSDAGRTINLFDSYGIAEMTHTDGAFSIGNDKVTIMNAILI